MDELKKNIPSHWVISKLGEVVRTTSGGTPSRKNSAFYEGNIPWVKSGELNYDVITETEEYVSNEAIKKSSAKVFPKGTLLIALYGTTIGKLAFLGVDAATNQAICAIFQNKVFELKILYYFLFYIKQDLIKQGVGGAQPNISQTILKNMEIPIAPLPEQRAIISKIELLFSELDNGIVNLKLAQGQLKVYRQAVLKKAFEGELTRKWREQQVNLPDAEELLEEIRSKREEVAKVSGKNLKTLKPLTEEDVAELQKPPKGWKWVKIGDVSNCLDSQRVPVNKSERFKRTGDIPYYGANGQVGWIDDYLFDETLVLVVEDETFTGREKTFSYIIIGKSWVNNHAHILQATSELNVDFLNYQLSYYPFTPLTTGTTGRKKLTQLALVNAPFRMCSLQEQHAIVQQIEMRLSVCDKLEQDIAENLERAEALRQSILKRAFEGKLLNEREVEEVRNAPDWEPAEKLLERIKLKKKNKSKGV
jgi:type I restriction enzyme S subunit